MRFTLPAVAFLIHYLAAALVCGAVFRRVDGAGPGAPAGRRHDEPYERRQRLAALLIGTGLAPFVDRPAGKERCRHGEQQEIKRQAEPDSGEEDREEETVDHVQQQAEPFQRRERQPAGRQDPEQHQTCREPVREQHEQVSRAR